MAEESHDRTAAAAVTYTMVERLVEAGDVDTAEALLDARSPAVLDVSDPHDRAAAQALHDAGRALVAMRRGEVAAARVFAASAVLLRRGLGVPVETDEWLLEIASIATLAGATDEVEDLHHRLGPALDPQRRAVLAGFATPDDVSSDVPQRRDLLRLGTALRAAMGPTPAPAV